MEYAYNDKLTITANSIAYEYKPYLESDNSLNVRRKWSYKTTNSIFSLAFEKIAMAIDEILSRGKRLFKWRRNKKNGRNKEKDILLPPVWLIIACRQRGDGAKGSINAFTSNTRSFINSR